MAIHSVTLNVISHDPKTGLIIGSDANTGAIQQTVIPGSLGSQIEYGTVITINRHVADQPVVETPFDIARRYTLANAAVDGGAE